jgi:hypothetical protein
MLDEFPDPWMRALAHEAEGYARDAFGAHLRLEPIKPLGLPYFLYDRYALWRGELFGRPAIFIVPQSGVVGGVDEYLKHRDQIRRNLDASLFVLLLKGVPAALRRQLVHKGVAFISPGAQFYVPEALLDLRETYSEELTPPPTQISPTAQVVLLGALLRHQVDDASLTHLADRYQVAVMSMSRALDELEALELAKPHRVGRQRRLNLRYGEGELWRAIREKLQSPVRKTRLVTGNLPLNEAVLAGESALARYTPLTEPRIECRAVPAAVWKRMARHLELQPAWAYQEDRIEVQTWAYDPQVLTDSEVVDPLSLYLSTRQDTDERVAQAAEQLLEPFGW